MFETLLQLLKRVLMLTGYFANDSYPKPLSPEEETKLVEAYKLGDKQAREKLITHNMRLVAHIAKKYAHGDTDDMISIGSIGLIKGVETYSAGKGTSLATYLARCIENEILMYLRSQKRYQNTVYLQSPLGVDADGNEYTLLDVIAESEDNVFEQTESVLLKEHLLKVMDDCLDKREKQIVMLRYGLGDGVPLTQKETAKKLGISRSYISRIETRALQKMQLALKQ